MLDMVRANQLALAIAHDLMGHSCALLKLAYTPAPSLHNTASDETGVSKQLSPSRHSFFQLKIRMVTSPVLNHHHRDVIRPCALGYGLCPTVAGRAGQTTLPFKRLRHPVNLDDTLPRAAW